MMPTDLAKLKEAYERSLEENASVRAELAALRGELAALSRRMQELRRTNAELSEKNRKLSEQKEVLLSLQQQKEDLFAMLAHDIKNPAALIKGLVELLKSYDLTAVEQQDVLEDLLKTSTRIFSLAQEISQVVTLESGALELEYMEYSFPDLVNDVVRRFVPMAMDKQIQIQTSIHPLVGNAMMDAQKVEEVVENLLSNALKYSPPKSKIDVTVRLENNTVVTEVKDNGLGLSAEDIKEAFGKGKRLSAKPTAGETSSGLGLWIVKRIVDAHNGRVWLRSALGRGSTFAFSIPLKPSIAVE